MKKETAKVADNSKGHISTDLDFSILKLGDKWKFRIIDLLLKQGSMRFSMLQKCLHLISPTVLSEQLRHLESSGVILHVEGEGKKWTYRLASRGLRAVGIIREMEKWGMESRADDAEQDELVSAGDLATAGDFSLLKQMMVVRKVRKNEFLLEQGSVCNFIGFVETGALRSFVCHDGEEMNNDFYLKGSVVCALTSFLSRRPTNCNIQALQDTEVTLIGYERYQALVENQLDWLKFAKLVSDSFFMRKCRRETSFLKHNTTEKLAMARDMFPGIDQIVPQYHIASYIGVRAESLSRSKLVTQLKR